MRREGRLKFFVWIKAYWPQISYALSGATALAGFIWRKKIIVWITSYRERKRLLAEIPTLREQLAAMQSQLEEIARELKFNGGRSTKDILASLHELIELSDMRLMMYQQASPVGIYECDATGKCTSANPALCELFGMTEQEMLGNGWLEAVGRNQVEKKLVFENWQASVRDNIPYREDYWIVPRTGEAILCTMYAQALRSRSTGKVLRFHGVVNPKPQGKRNSQDA